MKPTWKQEQQNRVIVFRNISELKIFCVQIRWAQVTCMGFPLGTTLKDSMFTAIWHRTRMPHTLTEQHTNKTPSTNDNLNITSASTNKIPFCFRLLPFVAFIVGCQHPIRNQFFETCDQGKFIPLPIQNSRWFVAASCYRVSEADMGKTTMSHMLGGVWGGNPQFLRFRVCRIRDETFTQQSRSVGGQCFTTFFPPDFFFGDVGGER